MHHSFSLLCNTKQTERDYNLNVTVNSLINSVRILTAIKLLGCTHNAKPPVSSKARNWNILPKSLSKMVSQSFLVRFYFPCYRWARGQRTPRGTRPEGGHKTRTWANIVAVTSCCQVASSVINWHCSDKKPARWEGRYRMCSSKKIALAESKVGRLLRNICTLSETPEKFSKLIDFIKLFYVSFYVFSVWLFNAKYTVNFLFTLLPNRYLKVSITIFLNQQVKN